MQGAQCRSSCWCSAVDHFTHPRILTSLNANLIQLLDKASFSTCCALEMYFWHVTQRLYKAMKQKRVKLPRNNKTVNIEVFGNETSHNMYFIIEIYPDSHVYLFKQRMHLNHI